MKIDLEKIYIAVFFLVFLLIGPGFLLDHKIKHEFPYGYLASDAFQHQVRAEAIKDIGNFKYEAFYISQGFKDAVGRYPPILAHLTAVISVVSSLETYDSIILVSFLFISASALIFYLIIKKFSEGVAILSLPLSLLVFSKAPFTGFLWGHWPSFLGQFFLIALIWALANADVKNSYILIAIFLAGIALGHTVVLFPGLAVLAVYLISKAARKELKFAELRNLLIAAVIAAISSFYYLVIFMNSWAKANPFSFSPLAVWEGNPGLYLLDFKLLAALMAIGLVLSLMRLKNFIAAASVSMLLLGFGNYITFPDRAFQLRFFWPIYLSFFFGLSAYHLAKTASKNMSKAKFIAVGGIFIFGLAGFAKIPGILQAERFSTQGVMDGAHWEVMEWLSKNIPQDSSVYFFYGDIYNQDAILRNSKRNHFLIDPQDYAEAIKDRKIKREYLTERPGDGGGGTVYKKSFFQFGSHQSEEELEYFYGQRDICAFDYYVFDKAAVQPAFSGYNMLMASELLKKDFIKLEFDNKISIILKNGEPGEDCIEERDF